MLNEQDLKLLMPYLSNGTVLHIDVKDRGRKGREVLLEYEDGRKLVGILEQKPFRMQELTGLTSIASYFARGYYGSSSWRGNCSGLLIRDLLKHYQPDTFGDLAVGSGTSIEVARELGYTSANSVFSDLNPKYGGIDLSGADLDFPLLDLIFFHPPYFVFPGSAMPVYSGKGGMWGDTIHPGDGSRISDPAMFKRWFDTCNVNLFRLLKKGGRLAILMGDSRYQGQYYSMFKEMDLYGELEQVIIKEQHNCMTDSLKYSGKFIPLEHEYLVILRKAGPYIVPIHHVQHVIRDVRQSKKATWANIVSMILEDHGGTMRRRELVQKMEQHPKAEGNSHIPEKLRQLLQTHKKMFISDSSSVSLAIPA